MKIKTDFITNSSSSSFIVAIPKQPKNVNDLNIYGPSKAECCFADIQNQKGIRITEKSIPRLTKKLAKEVSHGYVNGLISWDEVYDKLKMEDDNFKNLRGITEKVDKIRKPMVEEYVVNFLKSNMGKIIYIFSYSDEDGVFFSEMEHGGTFENYNHILISHH